MDEKDITMNMKETVDPQHRSDLIEIGGKNQVPCLVVDGKPMYESEDIIAYLKETL
jgi:glutathione S-transferase